MIELLNEIRYWFADNQDCIRDTASITAKNGFEELNRDGYIDEVDLDGIAEEIADEIQKGVLNVLDTYILDLKNEYQGH